MTDNGRNLTIPGTVLSLLIVFFFVAWQETDPEFLQLMCREDGPLETTTAILFGLASVCFFMVAYRSEFLKERSKISYFMIISWALLMFVFMGEEISWGQRIFGITTPESLAEINLQGETNLHNIAIIDTFMGGKYRWLSIMMITTGLLLPLFALTEFGKRIIQYFAFPVSPLYFWPLFVGAYVFGKYYNPYMGNDASSEVREFLMSVGMFGFALIGALSPCTMFRTCEKQSG